MSSIIFLFNSERNSRSRTQLWERFIAESGARYLSDAGEIKSAKLASCIFTHSREYQEKISSIVGDIGDVPVVVFTGGMHGRTIRVDEKRKSTFWMSIEMLMPKVDELVVGLLAKINNGATANEVWEYIREHNRSAFPEALIAAYLLMIANEKVGVPLNFPQWEEACEQYKAISEEKDADWSNASGWGADEIRKVKKKIGELFSQVASQV